MSDLSAKIEVRVVGVSSTRPMAEAVKNLTTAVDESREEWLRRVLEPALGRTLSPHLDEETRKRVEIMIRTDGSEEVVLDGRPILVFGPIQFEEVPTYGGSTTRIFRTVRHLAG